MWEEMRSSLGFLGNPLGSMPRARDSGDPGPPLPYTGARVLPSAPLKASASRSGLFSELNPHGLLSLLCTLRHPPVARRMATLATDVPATHSSGGPFTRWIPLRGFTISSQILLFQAFSQRDSGSFRADMLTAALWSALS